MHGLGNDYVYLNAVSEPGIIVQRDLSALARRMSDRHRGIGSDGLIVIAEPTAESKIATVQGVRMIMFNADGSRGEMCGNGIRCVCKYAVDHGLVDRDVNPIFVETDAGVLTLEYETDEDDDDRVSAVTVDMGAPTLDPESIGVIQSEVDGDPDLNAVFVGMGNPHAVFFLDGDEGGEADLKSLDLESLGPTIENHRAFSNRINAHFVSVISRNEVHMRTWERGSGITLACGTGAAAVCVAGARSGRTDRNVLIHLPGGDLDLRWDELTDHVYMTGPAVEVFHGSWPE